MDVNQTGTAFCRKKERWCKEQGRQGARDLCLAQGADVQDPGLWHEGVGGTFTTGVPTTDYLGWT